MENDGGGWMVIGRREDGSVNFDREWDDYKFGFGFLAGEFWAGNELVHKLTNAGRTYTLRVDLSNYAGESVYAKYSNFSVGPESDNYRLHVTGYDTSSSASDKLGEHDGCMFSTASKDNDAHESRCFAALYGAPWWYCLNRDVIFTGLYGEHSTIPSGKKGIRWYKPWGLKIYAKQGVMMIRPN
ncbi:hypothetical protein LSH36_91g05012 [Paralvinella palmiformis]|uniref:Fibrinogen C-terminal domain-containing protein n=1 Tax=Paralvinella palmiformis TaxID=53620 RepID=A0AAD9K0V3_9ANNE|nr:hypothetical protein LSH36_91g05012 [Paralvinella palmiformis]